MLDWLADLKNGLARITGAVAPSAGVGVFGKHPGWDDHLDDIGLHSDALIAAKQLVYVRGIGGVVDAGQWDADGEAADVLPAFRHLFFWSDSRSLVVGRLWSSSDGKGRTKYPMIACVHLEGRTEPGIPDIAPLLEELEVQCKSATTADEVRGILAKEAVRCPGLLAASAVVSPARKDYLAQLGFDMGSDSAVRIAYSVASYFAPLAQSALLKSAIHLRLAESNVQPQHLRFPAVSGFPTAAFQFWREFLAGVLPGSVPQLFIVPLDAPWVDVIVGLPTPKHLACLKIGPKQMPLCSEIPYTIEGEHRAAAEAAWRAFLA